MSLSSIVSQQRNNKNKYGLHSLFNQRHVDTAVINQSFVGKVTVGSRDARRMLSRRLVWTALMANAFYKQAYWLCFPEIAFECSSITLELRRSLRPPSRLTNAQQARTAGTAPTFVRSLSSEVPLDAFTSGARSRCVKLHRLWTHLQSHLFIGATSSFERGSSRSSRHKIDNEHFWKIAWLKQNASWGKVNRVHTEEFTQSFNKLDILGIWTCLKENNAIIKNECLVP